MRPYGVLMKAMGLKGARFCAGRAALQAQREQGAAAATGPEPGRAPQSTLPAPAAG